MLSSVQNPSDVVQVSVPWTSGESIVKKHIKERPIDLLSIDAEGYEAVILRSIDFSKIPIRAILLSNFILRQMRNLLATIRSLDWPRK